MSRARAAAIVVVALLALLAVGLRPAAAQEAPTTTAPDPLGTILPGPTTTTAPTTTTEPPSIPPQDSAPSTTAPIVDPAAGGDAPAAAVPDPNQVDQASAVTLPIAEGRAVKVDVTRAASSAADAKAAADAASAKRAALEASLASLHQRISALDLVAKGLVTELVAARDGLRRRAVDAYVRGIDEVGELGTDLSPEGVDRDMTRGPLLRAVVDEDQAAVDRLDRARKATSTSQATLAQAVLTAEQKLADARIDEERAINAAQHAAVVLAVTTAGGDFVIDGFTFPVAAPYSFTDSFGAPRLAGTPQAHWHQGCDIIAPDHAELLAAERGVVRYLLSGGLGGTGVWLVGESGTAYYYAHLSEYAPGLHAGQVVEAGELVGYVGSTGDAMTPHLHFEVHPGGGPAVNPYPLLVAADEQAKQQAAAKSPAP